MSSREVLIILAHAQMCERCLNRLLAEPDAVFRGRALSDEERAMLGGLTIADFATSELLAQASGCGSRELSEYQEHPVARLRHF